MATSRETLKYYFRKYALPTEQQFAELIDAFVHKDEDLLAQEKIDGLVTALEKKVTTETFENFKTEIQTQIGNGTITVDSTIDSSSTNPVENRAVYEALQDKAEDSEFQELKTKIEAFLEDTDASDEAINKWKEIESFLQGIKDTETLTGMLADLKAEILESIPETPKGNFVKQILDLSTYEGENGEIVQYIGQTTEEFIRGWFYERKEGEGETTITSAPLTISANAIEFFDGEDSGDISGEYESVDTVLKYATWNSKGYIINYPPVAGQKITMGSNGRIDEYTDDYFSPQTVDEYFSESMIYIGKWLYRRKTDGLIIAVPTAPTTWGGNSAQAKYVFVMEDEKNIKSVYREKSGVYTIGQWGEVTSETIGNSSWQPIAVSPCVN